MAEIKLPIHVNFPDDWMEQIVNRLRNDPEAEWVEIVRCKDCKHVQHDEVFDRYWCNGREVTADWYCADGERG